MAFNGAGGFGGGGFGGQMGGSGFGSQMGGGFAPAGTMMMSGGGQFMSVGGGMYMNTQSGSYSSNPYSTSMSSNQFGSNQFGTNSSMQFQGQQNIPMVRVDSRELGVKFDHDETVVLPLPSLEAFKRLVRVLPDSVKERLPWRIRSHTPMLDLSDFDVDERTRTIVKELVKDSPMGGFIRVDRESYFERMAKNPLLCLLLPFQICGLLLLGQFLLIPMFFFQFLYQVLICLTLPFTLLLRICFPESMGCIHNELMRNRIGEMLMPANSKLIKELMREVDTSKVRLVRTKTYGTTNEIVEMTVAKANKASVAFISHKWFGNNYDNDKHELLAFIRGVETEFVWIDHLCADVKTIAKDVLTSTRLLDTADFRVFHGPSDDMYYSSSWCFFEYVTAMSGSFNVAKRTLAADLEHSTFMQKSAASFRMWNPEDWKPMAMGIIINPRYTVSTHARTFALLQDFRARAAIEVMLLENGRTPTQAPVEAGGAPVPAHIEADRAPPLSTPQSSPSAMPAQQLALHTPKEIDQIV